MLKWQKTGWNTHFRQCKNVKIKLSPGLRQWTSFKVGLQCPSIPPPARKARELRLLAFNVHLYSDENSRFDYFFLFRPLWLTLFFLMFPFDPLENIRKSWEIDRWQMFFKIGVLKNFAIFTGKHLCWKACHFIKKRLQHKCFTVNITKFKNNFFYRTPLVAASERTLLRMYSKNFPNLFNQMFQNSFTGQ